MSRLIFLVWILTCHPFSFTIPLPPSVRPKIFNSPFFWSSTLSFLKSASLNVNLTGISNIAYPGGAWTSLHHTSYVSVVCGMLSIVSIFVVPSSFDMIVFKGAPEQSSLSYIPNSAPANPFPFSSIFFAWTRTLHLSLATGSLIVGVLSATAFLSVNFWLLSLIPLITITCISPSLLYPSGARYSLICNSQVGKAVLLISAAVVNISSDAGTLPLNLASLSAKCLRSYFIFPFLSVTKYQVLLRL